MLRGYILPDYDLLSVLSKKVLDKIDAVIPTFAQSRLRGEGWDLSIPLDAAMRFVAEAESLKSPVEAQFRQGALPGTDPLRENPVIQTLAMTIANADARELRARMEYYLSMSKDNGAGQNSLMPSLAVKPEDAFKKAFLRDIATVDGEVVRNFNPRENSRDAAIQWAVTPERKRNIRSERAVEETLDGPTYNGGRFILIAVSIR